MILHTLDVPDQLRASLPGSESISVYRTDTGCTIIVSHDPGKFGSGDRLRWHLSIAHPHRNPMWREIKFARYQLLGDDLTVAMLLPPKKQYVNVHEHAFHLWEIDT